MRVLSELEPKNVFSFFEDICNIPHPSYKEEKISNYLVDFAKESLNIIRIHLTM
jgi:dipeptidase D